jgi:hypothetical protein
MSHSKDKVWLQDYEEFLNSENTKVPKTIENQTFQKIVKWLNPNPALVFLKVLGIHLFTGVLSLSICHQFDMNPFNTSFSISDWMMNFGGHHFCMLGCGIIFVGLGILAAGAFLTLEEILALRKTEILQTLVLCLISLGLFMAFGAELSLSISAIWILGGVAGGYMATESIFRLKRVSISGL